MKKKPYQVVFDVSFTFDCKAESEEQAIALARAKLRESNWDRMGFEAQLSDIEAEEQSDD
jgi:hypothetical protein